MNALNKKTVDDIKLKSLRDGRARKFGKYEVLRDLITTDGNDIAINDTLCSINEAGSVFKVLVNQLKKKSRKDKEIVDISAVIYCERDSHKGIIIGKGGSLLKKIASTARQDIESMLGTKVNLKVWVKVKEDWQEKDSIVNKFKLK